MTCWKVKIYVANSMDCACLREGTVWWQTNLCAVTSFAPSPCGLTLVNYVSVLELGYKFKTRHEHEMSMNYFHMFYMVAILKYHHLTPQYNWKTERLGKSTKISTYTENCTFNK